MTDLPNADPESRAETLMASPDKVVKVRGMDITIVTTAQDDDEARALLRAIGFPFAGEPAVSVAG